MKLTKELFLSAGLIALFACIGFAPGAEAAERGFFVDKPTEGKDSLAHTALSCEGKVRVVIDAADESVHGTPAIFGTGPGGGEGGQFDPTPVLTVKNLELNDGECINAHLSGIIGSAQTYGVAPLTLVQVTLTPVNGGGPVHMVGHYETPYGIPSPAVALEAEGDVDMIAANFFQKVGDDKHEVRPGVYDAHVWWAGAPPGVAGGAIGAAFVLKLYLRD